MVLFFTSNAVDPPAIIYMGKDKVENEDLIKYGLVNDVWFHVDKLSSAHVYLRMPADMNWESIPQALLVDCAQLVKANSIQGNKTNDLTVIYTPWDNLKKSGDMAVGQVSFHHAKKVKRIHVPARENAIINRLNKTKDEHDVDHEAERQARLRLEGQQRKAAAADKKRADAELSKKREAEKQAKSYDSLFTEEAGYGVPAEKTEGWDPEEDFM